MADYIMGNHEVNALRIENTNKITFGLVTTGPIAISWGDGTVLNLSNQSSKYWANKLYSSTGNWNIVITGVENVKEIYFDNTVGYGYSGRITSSTTWLIQFINLDFFYLRSVGASGSSFIGDFGVALGKLTKLTRLCLNYPNPSTTFDIDACKEFWTRATYVYFLAGNSNFCKGSVSSINLPLNCTYFYFSSMHITPYAAQNVDGIWKNGYTKLTYFGLYLYSGICTNFNNFDEWIIPDTLLSLVTIRGVYFNNGSYNCGRLNNFNFKNLTYFSTECSHSDGDLTNNQSFKTFLTKATVFAITWNYIDNLKFDLAWATNKYSSFTIYYGSRYNNQMYGDATYLLANTSAGLILSGSFNISSIYGSLNEINSFINNAAIVIERTSITSSAAALKAIIKKLSGIKLWTNPNMNCDISGCEFTLINNNFWGITIRNMANLIADITTFIFGNFYTTTYLPIYLSQNPNFTGNLDNLTLWANKSTIDLSYCAYTNIPGFIQKIFTNRNTCLKATGGTTAIYVQGNVDNNLLTGNLQSPSLGTYTGNIHNLTEEQIDFLAQGLDYTGTGTSTPWTNKEKIWFLTSCCNSSVDLSKRYRVAITF